MPARKQEKKPMNDKKTIKKMLIVPILAAVYMLLAWLLLVAEKNGNGTIKTWSDALWYTFVTMTTVGYGDMYPVTPCGRVIGFIFIMMSMGALAALFFFIVRVVLSEALIYLQIRLVKNKPWHIFLNDNDESRELAEGISRESGNSRAICIFTGVTDDTGYGHRSLRTALSADKILALGRDIKGIYLAGGEGKVNIHTALSLKETILKTGHDDALDIPVYCDTGDLDFPENGNNKFFNMSSMMARKYWQEHLLKPEETCVVLIGLGRNGSALLTQGLLVNACGIEKHVEWHIFGNSSDFKGKHRFLDQVFAIDEISTEKDSIFFDGNDWSTDAPLICDKADRIILCMDSDEENLKVLSDMEKYYSINCNIDVQFSSDNMCAVSGEQLQNRITAFGFSKDLYIPELVMRKELDRIARRMNEIYCEESGGGCDWSELSDFIKTSNIASADHISTKIAILTGDYDNCGVTDENCQKAYSAYLEEIKKNPDAVKRFERIEHDRWLKLYAMYNWRYADKRNDSMRLHHCMVPYDRLTADERRKDDYAWELIGRIAK